MIYLSKGGAGADSDHTWIRPCTITFSVPRSKKQLGDRALSVAGPRLWNELPPSIRGCSELPGFKGRLKSHLFPTYFFSLSFSLAPCILCKRRYTNLIIIIIIIS